MKRLFLFCAFLSCGLFACGSGGSSGETTYGSLSLSVDKEAVNCGDVAVATVILRSSIAGKPLNGITVRLMSTDRTAIDDVSGSTNISGVATIVLPAKWIASDKEVILVAGADGVSQSTTQPLTVVAPKLTVNLPPTSDNTFKAGGGIGQIIMQGTTMSFLNGSGNAIVGQNINLYIDSITNKQDFEEVIFNPIQGSQISAPPGFLTAVTDSTGTAQIPMKVIIGIPSVAGALNVITLNWRAVTQYQGLTFTVTGSSQFTVTAS